MNLFKTIIYTSIIAFSSACAHSPGAHLTNTYYDIETRRMTGKNTLTDKIFMRSTYSTMVAGAMLVYPEAALTLNRCLNNGKRDLKLPNRYFKKSPHIKKIIKNKKPGTYGPYYLRQSADPRLSYTFNGYYIDIALTNNGKKKIKVYQLIDFSHATTKHKRNLDARGVTTTFYMGNSLTFKMSDTLIFVASKCQPFTAYSTWTTK
jgi:hypothetical protein